MIKTEEKTDLIVSDSKNEEDTLLISTEKDLMNILIAKTPFPPSVGDVVDGAVTAKDKTAVYVDLGIFGIGIIYGREYLNTRDIIKRTKIGDTIAAKVIDTGNKDGYVELSLREAKKAAFWNEAEAAIKTRTSYELPVKDANKGGLMLEWRGILGFLPASQLKLEHYPRVEDGDKDKIAVELKKLIGEKLEVSIIAADAEENKLIFSEKTPRSPERELIVSKYEVGDTVEGEVTGGVDFGIFVKIEDGLEGLIHISEIDWSLVENPKELYPIGTKVQAKIIEIKDDKISLSIKALKENPWNKVEAEYKKGDKVKGVVIKFNRYGALISIEEGVAGLIHISEFDSSLEKLKEVLELGKTYDFEITLFEPKEQKMALVLVKNHK